MKKIKKLLEDINGKTDLRNVLLAHNTSLKAKQEILKDGFHLKNFGQTSKEMGQNYHVSDPYGVFFNATDKPYRGDELSWKGKGNTDTIYARFKEVHPYFIEEFKGWREKLLSKFKAENGKQLSRILLKKGYDTVVIKDGDNFSEIIVLNPKILQLYATFSNAIHGNDYVESKVPDSPYNAVMQPIVLQTTEFGEKV